MKPGCTYRVFVETQEGVSFKVLTKDESGKLERHMQPDEWGGIEVQILKNIGKNYPIKPMEAQE